ncbi:MAG: M16 family metallopeptidase [Thermoanaerobaculia bacterium]
MPNLRSIRAFCWAPLLAVAVAGRADAAESLDIPYERFELPNGLTLIVHEDHKAPVVAVNVWYHVGSKNEPQGKSGFAHLFEHLMFNGSENYNDDYFKAFDRVGATGMNGTTNQDRTNYFEVVPKTALDVALWMESDRMGHLLGAVDQARLDEQRGVVQNEKRQGENQPYGKVWERMVRAIYPAGHPYHHSVIGSMEDLDAASLDDVHQWFQDYYGAANATLVVAGDVGAEEVHQKVLHYFGDIPSGPPVPRHKAWTATRSGSQREVMEDRVPQARLYRVSNVPPSTWPAAEQLYLAADILGDGKTSRLYKRLVYDDQIATDVSAFLWGGEIGSRFIIMATAQPGGDLGAVERAVDEELARFLADGPTAEEVARVQTEYRAEVVRGIERVGGFGGKSDLLAQGQVYYGDPGAWRRVLERVEAATPDPLRAAARRWLSDGDYNLEVRPFPQYTTTDSEVDRSGLPAVASFPEPEFPAFERAELSGGLDLIVATRTSVPVVTLGLQLDAGYAADQFAAAGTASLALDMLDEGTERRSALEISEQLARLGAELSTSSTVDTSYVELSALKENLDASLDIFADVVLHPSFPEDELARLKKQRLAEIQQEQVSPFSMGLRVLPKLLYGEDHAYGQPFTGSGYVETVEAMRRDDLRRFHDSWFRPNRATLLVVGDTTLEEIRPKLEALFASWQPGEAPEKNLATVEGSGGGVVYLIDRPDSDQSVIFAGHLAVPRNNPDEVALQAANDVLGGSFTARINMNLREDKHWSYGTRSIIIDAQGQRPWFVYAPVQTDKTAESMAEIRRELTGIVGEAPPTADEVEKVKDQNTLTLPGLWETNDAVLGSVSEVVRFGLADDYWDRYPESVRALDRDAVAGAAAQVVRPEELVWVVVGDRKEIEAGVREIRLGEIRYLDADGEPVP